MRVATTFSSLIHTTADGLY